MAASMGSLTSASGYDNLVTGRGCRDKADVRLFCLAPQAALRPCWLRGVSLHQLSAGSVRAFGAGYPTGRFDSGGSALSPCKSSGPKQSRCAAPSNFHSHSVVQLARTRHESAQSAFASRSSLGKRAGLEGLVSNNQFAHVRTTKPSSRLK